MWGRAGAEVRLTQVRRDVVGYASRAGTGRVTGGHAWRTRNRPGALKSAWLPLRLDQPCSAASARAVISLTLPVPLMARYFGAAEGSVLAHLA